MQYVEVLNDRDEAEIKCIKTCNDFKLLRLNTP